MLLQANFADFAPRVIAELEEEEIEGAVTNEGEIEAELTATGVSGSTGGENLIEMQPKKDVRRKTQDVSRALPHVGRNDPCPCGSGKKYKKCHGKNA